MDLVRNYLDKMPPRERQIVEDYLDGVGEKWERIQQKRSYAKLDREIRDLEFECAMDLYSFLMDGKWQVGSRNPEVSILPGRLF